MSDHIEKEIERLAKNYHDLAGKVNGLTLSVVQEVQGAKAEIMAHMGVLTTDQNDRIATLKEDWGQKFTGVRVELATIKARAAMVGMVIGSVGGAMIPVAMWLIDKALK